MLAEPLEIERSGAERNGGEREVGEREVGEREVGEREVGEGQGRAACHRGRVQQPTGAPRHHPREAGSVDR